MAPEDAVVHLLTLRHGALAAHPIEVREDQGEDLGGTEPGMPHQRHTTAVVGLGQGVRIGARQQGGDLGAREDGREAAWTGQGTRPVDGRSCLGHKER